MIAADAHRRLSRVELACVRAAALLREGRPRLALRELAVALHALPHGSVDPTWLGELAEACTRVDHLAERRCRRRWRSPDPLPPAA